MIHKEINRKNVLDLSSTDLAHEFSLLYVKELFNGHDLQLTGKNIVDTIIYVIEIAHPKSKDTVSLNKRWKIIEDLLANCKENLLSKGIKGVEQAILHAINMLTRSMLVQERILRVIK
jgi:hypothetical protein